MALTSGTRLGPYEIAAQIGVIAQIHGLDKSGPRETRNACASCPA